MERLADGGAGGYSLIRAGTCTPHLQSGAFEDLGLARKKRPSCR
jgi:hypothetical protein